MCCTLRYMWHQMPLELHANTLSSNVRIKRPRPAPEILILHHVCDRWSRLITEYGELTPPSQPSPLSQMFWVAPPKSDAVFMAFERSVGRNGNVPRAELRSITTTPWYKRVSTQAAKATLQALGPDAVDARRCLRFAHRLSEVTQVPARPREHDKRLRPNLTLCENRAGMAQPGKALDCYPGPLEDRGRYPMLERARGFKSPSSRSSGAPRKSLCIVRALAPVRGGDVVGGAEGRSGSRACSD